MLEEFEEENEELSDYEKEDLAEDLIRSWKSVREAADELDMDEDDLRWQFWDDEE
jgi:hypothetical protein